MTAHKKILEILNIIGDEHNAYCVQIYDDLMNCYNKIFVKREGDSNDIVKFDEMINKCKNNKNEFIKSYNNLMSIKFDDYSYECEQKMFEYITKSSYESLINKYDTLIMKIIKFKAVVDKMLMEVR